MMTANLFVIASVQQLRTDGSLEFYCFFSWTSCGVGILNSAIFNSFYNQVEFGMILEGLRNFGGGWTPPQYATTTEQNLTKNLQYSPRDMQQDKQSSLWGIKKYIKKYSPWDVQ